MGTHVNTSRSVIPGPKTQRHSQYFWVPGFVTSTSRVRAESGNANGGGVGRASHTKKALPCSSHLGRFRNRQPGGLHGCSFSLCFFLRSPNNNPQQARETLPASHVASARLLTRLISKHPTRSCWGQENYCQSTGGAIGTQFTARPRMRRHRRRLHDRQHGESFHLSSAHARQAPAITRLCL